MLFRDPLTRTGATFVTVAARYPITLAYYWDNKLACSDSIYYISP